MLSEMDWSNPNILSCSLYAGSTTITLNEGARMVSLDVSNSTVYKESPDPRGFAPISVTGIRVAERPGPCCSNYLAQARTASGSAVFRRLLPDPLPNVRLATCSRVRVGLFDSAHVRRG